jgi:magnesium chelatase family protein
MTEQAVSQSVARNLGSDCVLRLNGCPCGFNTHPRRECPCSARRISRYQKRIIGPLLDRIDVFVEVPPVECEKLVDRGPDEDSFGPRHRLG